MLVMTRAMLSIGWPMVSEFEEDPHNQSAKSDEKGQKSKVIFYFPTEEVQ